jgi:hypothetical protein
MKHLHRRITLVWASKPDLAEIRHATPVQRPGCVWPPEEGISALPLFSGLWPAFGNGQIERRTFGACGFG